MSNSVTSEPIWNFDRSYLDLYVAAIKFGLLPFLVSCGIGIGVAAVVFIGQVRRAGYLLLPAFAFAAVGAATGYFMGASRDSVVGAVAPAILTFISSVAAYQFAKRGGTYEPYRRALPIAVTAMLVASVFSATLSSASREKAEAYARQLEAHFQDVASGQELSRAEYKLRLEKVALPLELELLRREIGIDPPSGASAPAEKR